MTAPTTLAIWAELRQRGLLDAVREACAATGATLERVCSSARQYAPERRAAWAWLASRPDAPIPLRELAAGWSVAEAAVQAGIEQHRTGVAPTRAHRRTLPLAPAAEVESPLPAEREADETTPGLRAGRGERRDCAGYAACLTAFVKAMPRGDGGPARCPISCRAYQPIRLDVGAFSRRQGVAAAGDFGRMG